MLSRREYTPMVHIYRESVLVESAAQADASLEWDCDVAVMRNFIRTG
jgi:hypothetical protein